VVFSGFSVKGRVANDQMISWDKSNLNRFVFTQGPVHDSKPKLGLPVWWDYNYNRTLALAG